MARVTIIFCLLLAVVVAASKKKKPSGSPGKIVGGIDTDISDVPYQVSLQNKNRHDCGGSIITPKHILTAAHCVNGGSPRDYSIRAGSTSHSRGGETRKVTKIITHSEYDDDSLDNDIAILELDFPLTYTNKIQPIALAGSEPTHGELVLVSGWGAIREGGSSTRNLQSVMVSTISRLICQRYMKSTPITENMFCAGYISGGKDACQGDSGGPAVIWTPARELQAGIVSWGKGCAKRNSPGVYTNVAKYIPWIQANTR